MQRVMLSLVNSLKDEDPCYLADEDAAAALQHLERSGMVRKLPEHRGPSAWQLTRGGLGSLNISTWLSNPVRLFKGADGVQDAELHDVELHHRLAEAGWTCQVATTRSRAHAPTPYKKGEPKVFWLTEGQKCFDRFYFMCLLKAMEGSLQVAVPHLEQTSFYKSTLLGKEHVKKRRVSFAFGASAPAPRATKRARVASRSAGVDVADDSASHSGSDSDGSSSSSNGSASSASKTSSKSSGSSASGTPQPTSSSSSASNSRFKF